MTTPAEFAAMSGAAVIGSMGTETWKYVRDRILAVFRRHAPEDTGTVLERLDGYERSVSTASDSVRHTLAEAAQADITSLLSAVAARSAEAADAVRALPEQLREAPAAPAEHRPVIRNVKAGRDANVAGRDLHITKGDK
ncbi:hypothetical protein [Streptomyces qinglanensis]|uniref:hypothetical protein n=1 Tax=Streptomyces qinglanensis TaxID=943816 RepID=UPI0037B119E8